MTGQIQNELNEVFRNVFDSKSLQISRSMTAKDIEDWDSLNHINLIVATEKKFNIKFTTKEIRTLANVGEFEDLILTKLGQRN
jgi:acyl carrier protein